MDMNCHFSIGDTVQLLHTEKTGTIIYIYNDQATVNFEYITLTLPLDQIKPAHPSYLEPQKKFSFSTKNINNGGLNMHKFIAFNPMLDLHDLSIEEAIRILDKWIDQALLTGHTHLKIIHGKGKGLLRQKVYDYLRNHSLSIKIVKNHNFPGGSGVTLIEI